MAVEKRLYELTDIAEATSLKLATIRQYIHQKRIASIKLGRRRLVRKEELDRICTEGISSNPEVMGAKRTKKATVVTAKARRAKALAKKSSVQQ